MNSLIQSKNNNMNKKKKKKTGIFGTILNLFLFALSMVYILFSVLWNKIKEKKDRSS